MHEAALDDLAPATCYAYTLDAGSDLAGRFCTARASGDPVRFMAIGDTNPGLGDSTAKVLAQAIPRGPDFIVHAGDIQYYESTLETWALWFPVMAPMLRQGSFFPAIGNHESEKPTEFAEYYTRFFAGAGVGQLEYYRFDSGGVSFFSLDTELPFGAGSAQATWLEAGLVDAAAAPGHLFSVVLMHRPFVTCGDSGDKIAELDHFTPIFESNGVSLVIQGHMHGYERFEIGPITFVTTAGGGGLLGNVDENIDRPQCAMRVESGAFFHAALFEVSGGMLAGDVVDEDGVSRDSFTKALP
jgi:acid phosphatase type 7